VSAITIPGHSHVYSGKVRDIYQPDGDDTKLLLVASDQMSAFDHILENPIPDKGRVLTALSQWWFEELADVIPNHVLSTDVPQEVRRRAVLVEKLDMVEVECVARGYLVGSGLRDYERTGEICGISLPPGLVEGSRLPEPIFTPATKAPIGQHDENIDFEHVVETIGQASAEEVRDRTLELYAAGEAIARERGIILADTKFEFGRRADGTLVLADEVFTPDSSRFWPLDQWDPGRPQPSFDKQFVREWLTSPESGWDYRSGDKPPRLPDEIVERTRSRYIEAYERLTGQTFG
jgi:phosphoribosylaminoimidazole-succinocarboxamide synthase